MSKLSTAALTLTLLLAACVGVTPATDSPAPSPTLGVATMAPTAAPTTQPTATPTAAPTASPPTTDSPPPTLGPSPSASFDIDRRDLLFEDELDDPTSGWGIGTTADGGNAEYREGELVLTPSPGGISLWSQRALDASYGVLRVAGGFVPSGEGYFGLMCAVDEGVMYGATVSTAGAWILFSIDAAGTANVLASDMSAGLDIPVGESTGLLVECAGTTTGQFSMQFQLEETGIIATYSGTGDEPASFDAAAVYSEALADGYSVAVEAIAALALPAVGGQMTPDAQALLAHVPVAWQPSCFELPLPPVLGRGALASLTCYIDSTSEVAEYSQFTEKADMDFAYQQRVDSFGVESTGSCQSGPNETTYTIGTAVAGRLQCAPQLRGIRLDWTDDRLNILSTLTDFDGSYADAHADWLIGGPELGGVAPTAPPIASPATVTWSTTASEHGGSTGQQFAYECPAGGSPGTVWGTDVYTDDSSVCTAAVHAGLITLAGGGSVRIEMRPGQDSYPGSERNGITSANWGNWDSSFVFVTP